MPTDEDADPRGFRPARCLGYKSTVPKALIDFLGYAIYFWLNENEPLEPVHVHVAKGKPTPNATKVWITRSGVRLEHNNSKIPRNELKEILNFINENKDTVIVEWATRFGCTDFKEK